MAGVLWIELKPEEASATAREAFETRYNRYKLGEMKDENGNPVILTDDEALQIVDIRYTMSLIAYKKYETSVITGQIDEETVADIMEHMDELQGVGIEQTTIRKYNDSVYFAPIIGYTGKVRRNSFRSCRRKIRITILTMLWEEPVLSRLWSWSFREERDTQS